MKRSISALGKNRKSDLRLSSGGKGHKPEVHNSMGMARVARFPVPVHEPTHETGKSYVRPLAFAVVNNVVALCDAAAVAARNISLRGCLLSAQNGHSGFPIAVAQPNPGFSNWSPPKQTLPTSHSRPGAARRNNGPKADINTQMNVIAIY